MQIFSHSIHCNHLLLLTNGNSLLPSHSFSVKSLFKSKLIFAKLQMDIAKSKESLQVEKKTNSKISVFAHNVQFFGQRIKFYDTFNLRLSLRSVPEGQHACT